MDSCANRSIIKLRVKSLSNDGRRPAVNNHCNLMCAANKLLDQKISHAHVSVLDARYTTVTEHGGIMSHSTFTEMQAMHCNYS